MSGESILIVDDNPTNLKLVKVLLSIEGYHVYTATNAKEALQFLEILIPALILMDLQLPGMDGLELTRQLKANRQFQKIIILAVTAYAMKGDSERAFSAGCDGYIAKPIDTQLLPKLIEQYLQGKKE